ncbi:hypothetical protein PLESTB_001516500 [Pleodorina starrii]|uniref:Uncharacterized protein n=1 Tax=Pleodorina starrii TaxID=330485 RepID=A0A9W6BXM2_9CHLO|nr:hypothetical protein PLESTB_001516500 [Pleodorina starrii]
MQAWMTNGGSRKKNVSFHVFHFYVTGNCDGVNVGAGDHALWPSLAKITRDCSLDYDASKNQSTAYDAFGLFWRIGTTPWFESFLEHYNNRTGLNLGVKSRTISEYVRNWLEVWPTAQNPGPNDFWFLSAEVFGEDIGRNTFVDLTGFLIDDESYRLTDIPAAFRSAGSSAFAGVYSALPLSFTSFHLLYRRDVFAKYGIAVPRTWDEALAVAEKYGRGALGPGQPDLGFCFESNPICGFAHAMFILMLGTQVQLLGPTQGTWFDPDDLQPLYTHPTAFREALRLFLALKSHSVPDSNPCYAVYDMLASGRCLMLWGFSFVFKRASHNSSAMWGRQGVAMTPGSAIVVERNNPTSTPTPTATTTNATATPTPTPTATATATASGLVPCTPALCPFAQLEPRVVPTFLGADSSSSNTDSSNGTDNSSSSSGDGAPLLLVNRIVPIETGSFAINARAPMHRQAAAFAMLHEFTGPDNHRRLMLQPGTELAASYTPYTGVRRSGSPKA